MTAPADTPLTAKQLDATERNAPGSSMPGVWKETVLALVAEVRSSRLAAERAEEMATALENVAAGFRAGYTTGTQAKAVLLRQAERALAAYRGSAGGGTT